eukprot:scaffold1087_cov198-Pinguiococcus_pyrenoidosus.AAC.14
MVSNLDQLIVVRECGEDLRRYSLTTTMSAPFFRATNPKHLPLLLSGVTSQWRLTHSPRLEGRVLATKNIVNRPLRAL